MRLRLAWLVVLLPVVVFAQQRDATTTAPAAPAAGTGEITGVVMTAETTPRPMRRAVVTLTGAGDPRSVLSDDAGRFTFARLPAGTFTVTARKPAYLAAAYGARRPGRTGMPIALAAGQRTQITISMFRGSAITGQLRDGSGQPVGGVDVRLIDARTLLVAPDASSPQLATTDDRGVFRIYSLPPGDYFVVALPSVGGSGEIGAPSSASIDAALSMLASRPPIVPGAPATASTPTPPSRPFGFAPVYFPGTPDYREAARVHIDAGEERSGVDFELRPQPVAAIDGVVHGDMPNLPGVQVTLIPAGPRVATVMSSNSLSGRGIDAQGTFRYANLPPGPYRLVARARTGEIPQSPTPTLVNGVAIGRGGAGPPPGAAGAGTGDYLYGSADVEMRGDDIPGVTLNLQPGGTIAGRIVFAGSSSTPKPEEIAKMRVTLSPEGGGGMVSSNGLMMGNSLIAAPIVVVNPDGTFAIRGIGPGRFNFIAAFQTGSGTSPWKLRSVVASGRDLLDGAFDAGPGVNLRDVVITFTDAPTEISGTLQTSSGTPTTEYYIVALPADRALWQPRSRRILSVRPGTDGRFVFVDPPAGEYLIAALSDLDPIDLWDVSFLEPIAAAGVRIAVAEGEKKVQNLQMR